MKLAELEKRITIWGDLHTDFKKRFNSNRELAKDLVCFANTDGLDGCGYPVSPDMPEWATEAERHSFSCV